MGNTSSSRCLGSESGQKRKLAEDSEKLETNEKPSEKKRRLDEENKCSICLDTVSSPIMKPLPCGHVFHETCINTWLAISDVCPICRLSSTDAFYQVLLTDAVWLDNFIENAEERLERNGDGPDVEIVAGFNDADWYELGVHISDAEIAAQFNDVNEYQFSGSDKDESDVDN